MPASGSGPSGGRAPVGARVCVQGPNVPQVTLGDWWLSASHNRSTSQSRTRPFQEKVHIDKCAPPEGESSRNIRYTVVIAAAQRVQSFCSPGSAPPPPVSMRASCADSKLTPATGSSRSVLLVVQRKHPGGHDLAGGIAYLQELA